MSGDVALQVASFRYGAGVVNAGGAVVVRDIAVARQVDAVSQAIARCSA